MERETLHALLGAVAAGAMTPTDAAARLRTLPYEDLGFAKLDHHRALRGRLPEVILASGKTPEECAALAERFVVHGDRLLVTRADASQAEAVLAIAPEAVHHARARCLTWRAATRTPVESCGRVLICSGGTADLPIAEEAALTAELMDATVERIYDVGVAGLQRLLHHVDRLAEAEVIVVAAGMDGALPSVVAGLTAAPVVAVPTSIGYGAAFEGLSALLTMLNACAPGVAVVNIDNGFGAGYLAAAIVQGVVAPASATFAPIASVHSER